MMKQRISELWGHLANQGSMPNGHVKTLVDPSLPISVFLALMFPKRQKALLIGIPLRSRSLLEPFTGRAMKLEILSSKESQSEGYAALILTDPTLSEVFDVLIEDFLCALLTNDNKTISLKVFTERLATWQKLLETYSESGLSASAQQGLFGELIVLMRLLKEFPGKSQDILAAWQGPEKFRQDFQHKEWAIEVKTTTGADSVIIANEMQLSLNGLNILFLWHIVLDRHKKQGATLNHLVEDIRKTILNSTKAKELFNIRLATAGYYSHQSGLYEETGYFIRQESTFAVTRDFPALTPANIPIGISDVTYKVDLSACTSFVLAERTVYSTLNF